MPHAATNRSGLPPRFPTHKHEPRFWECLGRAVATFGFLEKQLVRAYCVLSATGTPPVGSEAEVKAVVDEWERSLKEAIRGQLGGLIKKFESALISHPIVLQTEDAANLVAGLREAATIRNVLCHASWESVGADGAHVPFFVRWDDIKFETAVDCAWLEQQQQRTADLICDVMDTVTQRGYQFPSSNSPGKPLS